MRQLRHPLRALGALALVAFTLTGCMKVDMDITLNSNDTIDGTVVVAVDRSMLTRFGSSPQEAYRRARSGMDPLPAGSRTEKYDDGRYFGEKIIYDDLPFHALSTGQPGSPALTHEHGRYTFSANLTAAGRSLGAQTALVAPFLNSVRITFTVTFPGKVIEHDPSALVSGNTVRWSVRLGADNRLLAVAEEAGGFPWLIVGLVGGVLGLLATIGIVLLVVWLNRRPAPGTGATAENPQPVPRYPAPRYPVSQQPEPQHPPDLPPAR